MLVTSQLLQFWFIIQAVWPNKQKLDGLPVYCTTSPYFLNISQKHWMICEITSSTSSALNANRNKVLRHLRLNLKRWEVRGFDELPGLSCMNSDFLCLRIIYLFREPRSIVNVAPSRERVGAYRTTHLIPLGMAQAPGLGHAGRRRIGRSSRVPPPWGRTPSRCSASVYTLQFRGEDQQGYTPLLFAAMLS